MTFEEYITKVLSIAKIGKKFSKDSYALDNYEELESLSLKMLEDQTGETFDANIFERNVYPTPNLSVRVLVVDENDKILFVKERSDGKWAVPGGWCDIFVSPRENAAKEVFEESGLEIVPDRLLAVFQRELYKNRIRTTYLSEYVMYFVAHVTNPKLNIGYEVSDAGFYSINDLPDISYKNTQEELHIAWDVLKNNKEVFID